MCRAAEGKQQVTNNTEKRCKERTVFLQHHSTSKIPPFHLKNNNNKKPTSSPSHNSRCTQVINKRITLHHTGRDMTLTEGSKTVHCSAALWPSEAVLEGYAAV